MLNGVITQAELISCIDGLMPQWRLIGPVVQREPLCKPPVRYFYKQVERADQIDLAFSYCVYGPKRFLLPPRETLYTFKKTELGFSASPNLDETRTAVVGVHPCDLHAIATLDAVFGADVRDQHYFSRRERLLLVGVDCPRPCTDGVFCCDMRANAIDDGFDVMLYPLGDPARFGVVFGTDAGRAWLAAGARHPTVADTLDFENYLRHKEAAFSRALTTPLDQLAGLLARSYDSLLWPAVGQRCYSCGSCNLVCPTCYCFDMEERNDLGLASGSRERTWDGCQLREFAVVAGDHNFRGRAAERLRHRIMRKGAWIAARSGRKGCVGCARCDRACTAHINSVEIYNQLAEEG